MDKLQEFIIKENNQRVEGYAKNIENEIFLRNLNKCLKKLEGRLSNENRGLKKFPNIFVFGLPRSGTTLVHQLLINSLSIGWPTNLMARFWEAPVVGMRLSRMMGLFNKKVGLKSDMGVTGEPHEPNEFGYFWMKWLGYDDVIIKSKSEEKKVRWKSLGKTLDRISSEVKMPIAYKNTLYAPHLERFSQVQPDSIFIYCKRDLADVAVSILKARKKRYGKENVWWSLKPRGFEKTLGKNNYHQISYQVKESEKIIEKEASKIKKGVALYTLEYKDISKQIGRIANTISKNLGIKKKSLKKPRIRISTYKGSKEYSKFKKIIEEI